jgi:hypothetical protein
MKQMRAAAYVTVILAGSTVEWCFKIRTTTHGMEGRKQSQRLSPAAVKLTREQR